MPATGTKKAPGTSWSREIWLPLLFFLLAAGVFLLLRRSELKAESARHGIETRVTAEQVQLRLESWIDSRTAVIEHFSDNWQSQFVSRSENFRGEALNFMQLYPGFQAINWIDSDWVIRIIVPENSNRPALNQDLHTHPSPGVVSAIRHATESGALSRTPVIDLLQGGKGFATYRAIVDEDGRLQGFINGVFRIDTLVDACLAEPALRTQFRFELIEEDGQVAYQHEVRTPPSSWPYGISTPVRVVNRPWILHMGLSETMLGPGGATAEGLILVAGLVLASVLALMLRVLLIRQRALRESEAKYKLLVENQTDLLVKVDANGRFLFVSPSYCQTFGNTEEQLLGEEFLLLAQEEGQATTAQTMEALRQPPHTAYLEQRAMAKDEWRWLGWAITAVRDSGGNIDALIGVGRDITKRKHLEEQLRQSQKLQAIGQLAGGVAHDFNNIIQGILGHLEIAVKRFQRNSEIDHDLDQIRKASLRAAGLTRQLLAFGRRQVLQPVNLDLNKAVANTLVMLRRVIGETTELVYLPGSDLELVHADPGQIEQALMNLCLNARDAMPNGGTITLQTRTEEYARGDRSRAPWTRPGRWIVLKVADTGHGMSPEVRDRIFEPFFTTKGVGKGTGLGLATVYGIMEQHEGWIHVESEENRGTEFQMFFPSVPGPVFEPETAAPSLPLGGTETLLIAEDEPMVRNVAASLLRSAGYEVLTAADGLEAMAVFQDHATQIDLVLLDAVMPGASGAEVYERLTKLDHQVRVLFTSGYSADKLPLSPDTENDVEFLQKPYDGDTLLLKIREMLDADVEKLT